MLGLPFLTKAKHEAIVRELIERYDGGIADLHAWHAQDKKSWTDRALAAEYDADAFAAACDERVIEADKHRRIAAENEAAWHTEIANSQELVKQHHADLAIERSVNERLKAQLARLTPKRGDRGRFVRGEG